MAYFQKIVKKRIQDEKEGLKSLNSEIYTTKVSEKNDRVDVEINKGKPSGNYAFSILVNNLYPFREPQIKLKLLQNQYSLVNTAENKSPEAFFKAPWTAGTTWNDIIYKVHDYVKKNIKTENPAKKDPNFQVFDILSRLPKRTGLLIVLAFAVILRIICGFGGYSGVNDPPIFGDYEAQRHWMELTVNLPPRDWYVETKHNDLKYWRIDYPPVSAYLSYLCGVLSQRFEPKSMALFASRGYETPSHKMFMRWTVLACDILLFISALTAFVLQAYRKYDFRTRLIALTLVLGSPLLILIDHGHFQYNCVTLGLTLWALILCVSEDIWIGSVLFVIALNVKQMALYYSIPFFCFILGKIYRICNLHIQKHQDSKSLRGFQFLAFVVQVGIFVVVSMLIIWWPWISSLEEIGNVFKAIFPVKRGLYQLKVATFWCVTDVLYKWQTHFSTDTLLLLSVGFTLLASLPSAVILTKVPKRKYFTIALFNISMAFFFFSYHVHEKTILLPILPFILNIRYFRTFYVDYILAATFTNYHMFIEDKLTVEYFVAMVFFAFFAHPVLQTFRKMWKKPAVEDKTKDVVQKTMDNFEEYYLKYISKALYVAMVGLTAADKFIAPPEKYPYLFHLLFAVVGFGEFFIVFLYSNVKLYLCYKKDYQKEIDALNYDMKAALGKLE